MSKGGSRTQTVQQINQVSPYVEDAQRQLASAAQRITAPYLVNTPPNLNANFTPDQVQAFQMARDMAQNAGASNPFSVWGLPLMPDAAQAASVPAVTPTSAWATPATASSAYANTAGTMLLPSTATVDPNAGQVSGENIAALLNPYRSGVLDPTIAEMRRQLNQTQAQIGARGASSAAFGGSRQALQSSEANRAFGDQVARTTAELMARGWDQASALAAANAQAAQQAGQFNAAAQNQAGQFNVGQQNQGNQFNTSAQNAINLANAAAQNQVGLSNAAAQNQMSLSNASAANQLGQFNTGLQAALNQYNTGQRNQMAGDTANRMLSAASTQNSFANDEQQRQLRALASLLQTGGQQQQLAQNYLREPIDMLKLLISATPGATGSTQTTTAPDNSPSPWQTIGGLGLSLAGLPLTGGASLGGSLLSRIFGLP